MLEHLWHRCNFQVTWYWCRLWAISRYSMRPRGQYFGCVDLMKIHNYLLPHRQNDINLEARVYRMTHGIMCVTITRNSCVTIDILEWILIGNADWTRDRETYWQQSIKNSWDVNSLWSVRFWICQSWLHRPTPACWILVICLWTLIALTLISIDRWNAGGSLKCCQLQHAF